jgi:hypothetical protein
VNSQEKIRWISEWVCKSLAEFPPGLAARACVVRTWWWNEASFGMKGISERPGRIHDVDSLPVRFHIGRRLFSRLRLQPPDRH